MDIYLGRQPILDREKRTVAYELLYRSGVDNAFPFINPDEATAKVLHHIFTTLGLEKIAKGKKVFINFTRELLLSDLPDLGYKNVVIEVLEGIEVDSALVNACRRLVKKGFTLALDDFQLDKNTEKLLSMASIIKIDWLADPVEKIEEICSRLKKHNFTLLAEKIETEEEFNRAVDMGFELFQGYFFSRPEIVKGKTLGLNTLSHFEILEVLNRNNSGLDEIAAVISNDVALVYKLLKIINSSMYNLRNPVDSVEKAVVLLGLQEIRKWFSVLIVSEMNSNSPEELMNLALSRAIFSQSIARHSGHRELEDEVFLAGLFSLLDAMLKIPFSDLMKQLPVSKNITEALVEHRGPLHPYLALSEAYELSDTAKIEKCLEAIGMESEDATICYMNAMFDASLALR